MGNQVGMQVQGPAQMRQEHRAHGPIGVVLAHWLQRSQIFKTRRGPVADAHKPRGTHTVQRHTQHALRQAAGIRAQPTDVVRLGALLLPRLLGHARAARLLLWGDGLDGTQAVDLGLANEAFEDGEQCLAAAQKMAQRLLTLPRESVLHTKRLLKKPLLEALKDTLRRENLLFMERLKSVEAKAVLEGMLQRSAEKG
ncbi:hypothetical protein GHO25_02860 [Pseudomonas sp. FSL R10-1350]|nr:hypothetical protein [Pseudomonas sp. FSL R10-1350]